MTTPTYTSIPVIKSFLSTWLVLNPKDFTAVKNANNTLNSQTQDAQKMIASAINVQNAIVYSPTILPNSYPTSHAYPNIPTLINGPSAFITFTSGGVTSSYTNGTVAPSVKYPDSSVWYQGASAANEVTITFYGSLYYNASHTEAWTGYTGFAGNASGLFDTYAARHVHDFSYNSNIIGNITNPWSKAGATKVGGGTPVYGGSLTVTVPLKWAYDYYQDSAVLNYLKAMYNAVVTSPDATQQQKNGVYAQLTDYQTNFKKIVAKYASLASQINSGKAAYTNAIATYVSTINSITGQSFTAPSPTSTVSTTSSAANNKNTKNPLGGGDFTFIPIQPKDCDFNLPPHNSSLPIPTNTSGDYVHKGTDDLERRGRFWYYADSNQSFTNATYSTASAKKGAVAGNNKYGFQFLWNPESYSVSVQINQDATPNSQMFWATAIPVYPSWESLAVSVILDRTNDFATYKAAGNDLSKIKSYYNVQTAGGADWTQDSKGINSTNTVDQKILNLMKYGTIADLEYLYKTINGDGWSNPISGNTSDIGFLSMTLVQIQIGPKKYLGYLNSLNITHEKFTQDMIPITTQVDLSFVLMSTASVSQQNGVGNTSTTSPKKLTGISGLTGGGARGD